MTPRTSRRLRLLLLAALVAGAAQLGGRPAAADDAAKRDRIKVLIIDGQNNHDWKHTTPVLKAALESSGRFEVDVATSPPGGASLERFQPDFRKYGVVVSNYNGAEWPDATKRAFEKYVGDGGGFVCVHAADNAFPKWQEYNRMIGVGGWGGRNEKSGPMIRWRDGKVVKDARGGHGTHGKYFSFVVETRNADHPITRGLPAKWKHAPDELYSTLCGPAENVTVLATAESDVTHEHEPMLMAITYGKGRVFHTTLGHSVESMKDVGFVTTLGRGAEWAATGRVTLPVPRDFPTADKVSKWDPPAGASLRDRKGEYLDVLLDGKPAARYMYAYDKSTKERLHETFKPYLHVFDAEGQAPITKGPGGLFTHHRGIFIGWMKIGHNGKTYDRWHMKGGEIVHQKFTEQKAGDDGATFTSRTHWNDGEGEPILEEDRTVTVRRAAAPFRLRIDCTFRLRPVRGDVTLDGDPEHAGVQFRPADDLDKTATVYVFPREQADAHKDRDYPWVGETFTLRGKKHSVVELNHPDNPRGTRWSAYRDYGRFGAFPTAEIKSGRELVLRYRFLVAHGEMPSASVVQRAWDEFAGAASASPAPRTTVRPAEQSPPAAKPKSGGKK